MGLKTVYLGSKESSKKILERTSLNPDAVVSFTDEHRERVSGFTTYEEYGDRWIQVDSINSDRAKSTLRDIEPDLIYVMSWPELLDSEIMDVPTHGCVGRHVSLLPKRRGRATVAWTLIQGLERTGVTLFWLDEGIDTGDIIAQQAFEVRRDDEASDVFARAADVTVELLEDVRPRFEEGEFPRTPQDDSEATYTHPRRPDMGLIDWEKSASTLYNFVRGQSHPYPGAFTYYKAYKVTVWHASIHHDVRKLGRPGEILETIGDSEFRIQTGEGILDIEVENPHDGVSLDEGDVLGCHAKQ